MKQLLFIFIFFLIGCIKEREYKELDTCETELNYCILDRARELDKHIVDSMYCKEKILSFQETLNFIEMMCFQDEDNKNDQTKTKR